MADHDRKAITVAKGTNPRQSPALDNASRTVGRTAPSAWNAQSSIDSNWNDHDHQHDQSRDALQLDDHTTQCWPYRKSHLAKEEEKGGRVCNFGNEMLLGALCCFGGSSGVKGSRSDRCYHEQKKSHSPGNQNGHSKTQRHPKNSKCSHPSGADSIRE